MKRCCEEVIEKQWVPFFKANFSFLFVVSSLVIFFWKLWFRILQFFLENLEFHNFFGNCNLEYYKLFQATTQLLNDFTRTCGFVWLYPEGDLRNEEFRTSKNRGWVHENIDRTFGLNDICNQHSNASKRGRINPISSVKWTQVKDLYSDSAHIHPIRYFLFLCPHFLTDAKRSALCSHPLVFWRAFPTMGFPVFNPILEMNQLLLTWYHSPMIACSPRKLLFCQTSLSYPRIKNRPVHDMMHLLIYWRLPQALP